MTPMRNDLPVPLYAIGDVVYYSTTTQATKQHPCPDCLGSRMWEVKTPAGTTLSVSCARCSGYLRLDGIPPLEFNTYVGRVERLTIGSIQIDTAAHLDSEWDDHVKYIMCVETGVGGGSVYPEKRLFPERESAEMSAHVLAEKANATLEAREPERIAEGKRFVHLTIRDAAIEEAQRETRHVQYKLDDALTELEDLRGAAQR
jgi:hypothetical protein